MNEFSKEQKAVLHSIRISRIIWPIMLGILVVLYLFWMQFEPEEFRKIDWTIHTWVWIAVAILLLVGRHLAYSFRLRILSDKQFSWRKCIELIFIWDFSSAISPTSLGGSAVALFVLSQEKLSTAKTSTIVIYTVVLDTMFFILTLPVLLILFGPGIIRPGLTEFNGLDGWGFTFLTAYFFMAAYGALFFYGLWFNPRQIKRLMVGFTRIGFLKKHRPRAVQLGDDIMRTSRELHYKPVHYHLSAFLATAIAWSFRFLLLSALIIGIVGNISLDFITQGQLYARLQSMFVVMAFSPTPGGSGFAEYVFGGFLSDYVPKGIALVVALIWRMLAYYTYLIAGVIILPNWINKLLKMRKERRKTQT